MTEFSIEDNALIREEPVYTSSCPYSYTYKNTVVITKEEFVACYNAWIKGEEDK